MGFENPENPFRFLLIAVSGWTNQRQFGDSYGQDKDDTVAYMKLLT